MNIKVRDYEVTKEDNKLILNIYIDQFCNNYLDATYYTISELVEEINYRRDIYAIRLYTTHKKHGQEIQSLLMQNGATKPFLYSRKCSLFRFKQK